jgi:DNA-binding CsgD family transcriptional regulator
VTVSAVQLLEHQPNVFWGKVVWVFIRRGWSPPKPDERIMADLLNAFERVGHDDVVAHRNDVLTDRQSEILQLFADGFDTVETADLLGIASATVKFHTTDLLRNLEAKNRSHAIAIGFRTGLIS